MLWQFMGDDDIPLMNNEAERALCGYVVWRKEIYWMCSHRGALSPRVAVRHRPSLHQEVGLPDSH